MVQRVWIFPCRIFGPVVRKVGREDESTGAGSKQGGGLWWRRKVATVGNDMLNNPDEGKGGHRFGVDHHVKTDVRRVSYSGEHQCQAIVWAKGKGQSLHREDFLTHRTKFSHHCPQSRSCQERIIKKRSLFRVSQQLCFFILPRTPEMSHAYIHILNYDPLENQSESYLSPSHSSKALCSRWVSYVSFPYPTLEMSHISTSSTTPTGKSTQIIPKVRHRKSFLFS